MGHCNEQGAFAWGEPQRLGEEVERFLAGRAVDAALQVADGAGAESSAFRERFLGQPGGLAILLKQCPKRGFSGAYGCAPLASVNARYSYHSTRSSASQTKGALKMWEMMWVFFLGI